MRSCNAMRSPRLPDRPSTGRRELADMLLRSWPGRLFIISAALKLVVAAFRLVAELPAVLSLLSSAATIGLVISLSVFVWRMFVLVKRRLLWRVRRRLILSYIFIGVVPALLLIIFFLLGGVLMFMNVSAYLFKDRYESIVDYVRLATEEAASEISRAPGSAAQTLGRVHRNASKKYRVLSFVYIPAPGGAPIAIGPWEHMPPHSSVPVWLWRRSYVGTVVRPSDESSDQVEAVLRAAIPVTISGAPGGYVIGDLPVNLEVAQTLQDETGVRAGPPSIVKPRAKSSGRAVADAEASAAVNGSFGALFRKSVIFLDYRDWAGGEDGQVSVGLNYRPGELYDRLSSAQRIVLGNNTFGQWAIVFLLLIATLFLIIEMVALSMGLALARSITSSIHELFMGTERVRHGDFAHRIDITTKDQLGELAGSFNEMTGSIEGLLLTAAEKKRLEEELRIARVIQMSLLPRGPIDVAGLGIAALCVPAREVGGDYYDFFRLPNDRLGVLIADVSGKGTSAALYMAELKGLVLALSQTYDSPRLLLIEVNRIISEHLDSRSFITMTYGVIDLRQGVMTYSRAGHTPLIYLPATATGVPTAQILIPGGMVLGLRIDGAAEKFVALLEEERVELGAGDVIVLYTDGITEAMNAESDLFGDERLSRLVEEHGHLDPGELRERILREIEAFVGGAGQHDDMTMILIKIEHASAAGERRLN